MNLIENYYKWNVNAISLSKVILKTSNTIPYIKKCSIFFIINIKQYKKNLLLFYIIVNLIFSGILILHNKKVQGLQIFNLKIRNNKIKSFLFIFINLYLPLLNTREIFIKKSTLPFFYENTNIFLYRLNFFTFPSVCELNFLYSQYEELHNFISNYRLQLDIYIKTYSYINNSLEFLLRVYRFPCILK